MIKYPGLISKTDAGRLRGKRLLSSEVSGLHKACHIKQINTKLKYTGKPIRAHYWPKHGICLLWN